MRYGSDQLFIGEVESADYETGTYEVVLSDARTVMATLLQDVSEAGGGSGTRLEEDTIVLVALTDEAYDGIILGTASNPSRPPVVPEEGEGRFMYHPEGVHVSSAPSAERKAAVHGPLPSDLNDGWASLKQAVTTSVTSIGTGTATSKTLATSAVSTLAGTGATPAVGSAAAAPDAAIMTYVSTLEAQVVNALTSIANAMATFETKLQNHQQYEAKKLTTE